MSQPYVGEIRAFGFNFAPSSWAFCNGQPLPISQYQVLFTIIGTTYGGNGQTTFNTPSFQGRAPIHQGQGTGLSNYVVGQSSGTADVTLLTTQIPQHNHNVTSVETTVAAQRSTTPGPTFFPGPSAPASGYIATGTPNVAFSPKTIGFTGSSLPHSNQQPLLALNFCIALFGIFPTRN